MTGFGIELERGELGHPHRITNAIQVIALVLQQDGIHALAVITHVLAAQGLIGDPDALMARHLAVQAGDRQTTLPPRLHSSVTGVTTGLTITTHGSAVSCTPSSRRGLSPSTTTRTLSNTCGAARLEPPTSTSVSFISPTKRAIPGSPGSATFAATQFRTGLPIRAILRIAMTLPPVVPGLDDIAGTDQHPDPMRRRGRQAGSAHESGPDLMVLDLRESDESPSPTPWSRPAVVAGVVAGAVVSVVGIALVEDGSVVPEPASLPTVAEPRPSPTSTDPVVPMDGDDAAVWTSVDGITWSKAGSIPGGIGTVTAGGPGLVVAGQIGLGLDGGDECPRHVSPRSMDPMLPRCDGHREPPHRASRECQRAPRYQSRVGGGCITQYGTPAFAPPLFLSPS
jgi:hypothetical protein